MDKTTEDIRAIYAHIDKTVGDSCGGIHHNLHQIKQTINMVARRGLERRARIKCLFIINRLELWDSLADIYADMKDATDFEPLVATIPRKRVDSDTFYGEEETHQNLLKMGVEHIRLPMVDSYAALDIIKIIDPEIIFMQTPFDGDIQLGFNPTELCFSRLCYVPYYGLQMTERYVAEVGAMNHFTDTYFHTFCWRIFCEDEFVKKEYERAAILSGRNVIVTGHPKLKRLDRLSRMGGAWPISSNALSEKRPYRVVWAPHHSVRSDWLNFGTFPATMHEMLDWARTDPHVEIVLKPHPLLFETLGLPDSAVSGETVSSFLSQWNALPNTAIVEGGNYAPLFVASDVMITDGISFLMEYQIFDKPLIFIERLDHVPFNELGNFVVEGVTRVSTVREAHQIVDSLRMGSPDPKLAQRHKVVARMVPKNEPAKIVLETIREGR